MVRSLHPVQACLLDILKKNIDDPLTIRELQDELKVSSPSVVQHHIRQLEKNGYLRRNPGNPRDYQIVADEPEKSITYLNLYGLVRCGPNGSILDGNPIDRIPIASRLLGFVSADAFMVRATGDSMSPRINDKDLVIVKRTAQVENGSIVVCVNRGAAMIKKISREGDQVILRSLNDKYHPFVAEDDFRIEGVVRSIISYPRTR
jgi:repressor LexA